LQALYVKFESDCEKLNQRVEERAVVVRGAHADGSYAGGLVGEFDAWADLLETMSRVARKRAERGVQRSSQIVWERKHN